MGLGLDVRPGDKEDSVKGSDMSAGLTRRRLLKGALAGGIVAVGAVALAGCGEAQIVEVVKEVPVEKIVQTTKEVPVEKIRIETVVVEKPAVQKVTILY